MINQQQVIDLLPMSECIELMDGAMRAASSRDAVMPLRAKMDLPYGGMLGWMPGALGNPDVFGMKLVAVFPGNFAHGMHSHHGVVVLFENEHGRPYAVVDASEITAIRTAAASALATRLLAREDSSAGYLGTRNCGSTRSDGRRQTVTRSPPATRASVNAA